MSVRGARLYPWILKPDGDATWTGEDWERARCLEARLCHAGVSEEERSRLIPCAVWKSKFPGLTYTDAVEVRLGSLLNKA